MVLLVVALVTLTSAALATVLFLRVPALDPASPRATTALVRRSLDATSSPGTRPVSHHMGEHTVERTVATGLLLTTAVVLVVAGGAAVGVLFWMVRRDAGLAAFDLRIASWAASHATRLSTDVLEGITELGSTLVVCVIAAVVGVVEFLRRRSVALFAFLVLVVGGQNVISNAVKALVDRARPDVDPLAGFSGPSFPSGHSAAAAATFAACALLVGRGRASRTQALLGGVAIAIAVAVASSRVLLGVHWLTDVLAGLALGWAWFAIGAIAFGGRLLRFGAPVELAERARELAVADDDQPAGYPGRPQQRRVIATEPPASAGGSDARDDESLDLGPTNQTNFSA
jgi:membrane-associated phospholipid phosphatase